MIASLDPSYASPNLYQSNPPLFDSCKSARTSCYCSRKAKLNDFSHILKSNINYLKLLFLFVELARSRLVVFFLLRVLIESVAFENHLDCIFSKQHLILFYQIRHLLILLCRLITHILSIVSTVRLKRRLQLSVHQLIPGKVS